MRTKILDRIQIKSLHYYDKLIINVLVILDQNGLDYIFCLFIGHY